jgi:coenzyme F420-0:L-glutamate ligase/coenzyme F420-1:gamma-L-glutamate ligase
MTFSVWAVALPEIVAGDDLAKLIQDAVGASLEDGDILAVTSKIVSKAEGRQVAAADREQAITEQTVRLVASREHTRGVTRIVENPQGLVMAAAGVDASNAPEGVVLLLPEDPDASALLLARALRSSTGKRIAVVLTDTLGRAWREGQTDAAIGAAGLHVVSDLRGSTDASGHVLEATIAAVADEIASAADLVKGKATGMPVAVVRGLGHLVGELDLPGARALIRPPENDMFRLGSEEAWREGYEAGLRAASVEDLHDSDASAP